MTKKQKKELEQMQAEMLNSQEQEPRILKKKTLKELIAPAGIDASHLDHLEIISNTTRYARSFLYLVFLECVLSRNYLEICIYLEI